MIRLSQFSCRAMLSTVSSVLPPEHLRYAVITRIQNHCFGDIMCPVELHACYFIQQNPPNPFCHDPTTITQPLPLNWPMLEMLPTCHWNVTDMTDESKKLPEKECHGTCQQILMFWHKFFWHRCRFAHIFGNNMTSFTHQNPSQWSLTMMTTTATTMTVGSFISFTPANWCVIMINFHYCF